MNSDNGNGVAVKSLQGSTGVQNKDESKYENPVSRVSSAQMAPSARTASLNHIFLSFFKIGAFTFGGGWAMVPLIKKELVDKRKWLEDESSSTSLPSPKAGLAQ